MAAPVPSRPPKRPPQDREWRCACNKLIVLGELKPGSRIQVVCDRCGRKFWITEPVRAVW
jgi:hypothetical protein